MLLTVGFFLTLFLSVFGNSIQVVTEDTGVQGAEEFPCKCLFYEHCNYRGKAKCYNGSTRWVGKEFNDLFSSVKVATGSMCRVFEHANYRGKSLIFRKNDKCFINNKLRRGGRRSWNDKISSVQVLPARCRCRFYQHCGFRGKSVCYNSNTKFVGSANDKISSVRVQKGFKCTAYEHWKFKGRSVTFYANDRCLTNNVRWRTRRRWSSWNDVISSVRVSRYNPCPCRLFQHCGYGGYSKCFRSNTKFVGKAHNDEYSSIKVARGYKCQVFQHARFKGHRTTFRGNDRCFLNNKIGKKGSFNDIVSSIKVSRNHTYDDMAEEEENDYYYMKFAIGGGVILSIAGLGLFAYKRRKQGAQEYEALLQEV